MSGLSTGGARGYQGKAPEKGIFPLDHFGECKKVQEQYLVCIKANSGKALACNELAKGYLQCRMDRNLMAKQDLVDLGFATAPGAPDAQQQAGNKAAVPNQRQRQGFTAGSQR